MVEFYEPKSEFLRSLFAEEISIEDGPSAEKNFQCLLTEMTDDDEVNRDWATYFAATSYDKSVELIEALLINANDVHDETKNEAILGLARRKDQRALDLVKREIESETVSIMMVEAAGALANDSLIPMLEELTTWWDVDEKMLHNAIEACATGDPSKHSFDWLFDV